VIRNAFRYPLSTTLLASSFNVHLTQPSGGSPQVRVIIFASASPSIFMTDGGVSRFLRSTADSKPFSQGAGAPCLPMTKSARRIRARTVTEIHAETRLVRLFCRACLGRQALPRCLHCNSEVHVEALFYKNRNPGLDKNVNLPS